MVLENASENKVVLNGGNTRIVFNLRNSFGTQAVVKSVLNASVRSLVGKDSIDVTSEAVIKLA